MSKEESAEFVTQASEIAGASVFKVSEILIPEKKKSYIDSDGKRRPLKGRADDDSRITWEYKQERSQIYAVLIEIIFPEEEVKS